MSNNTDLTKEQSEKTKLVCFSYFKWFTGAGVLAFFASIAAHYINLFLPFTEWHIKIFQIFSLVLEAGPLGQCGYNTQTWGGESPAERLNELLFTTFSSTGFFLIIFSFQLAPPPSL